LRILGFIGTDFVGGQEHEEGGIGPFLKEHVKEEEHDAQYVLERVARALRGMKIDDVTGLWIGDVPVVELGPDEAVGLNEALASAKAGEDAEPYAGLQLSLNFEDEKLLHLVTISYAQAHDPEEAALEVLDSAHVLALEPLEDEEAEAYEERLNALLEPHQTIEDFAAPYLELERPFVDRMLEALSKELSLLEPETSVEIDHEGLSSLDDLFNQSVASSSAFPGLDLQ
jgi:hypothetical protein